MRDFFLGELGFSSKAELFDVAKVFHSDILARQIMVQLDFGRSLFKHYVCDALDSGGDALSSALTLLSQQFEPITADRAVTAQCLEGNNNGMNLDSSHYEGNNNGMSG
jgi:hypothetical protein